MSPDTQRSSSQRFDASAGLPFTASIATAAVEALLDHFTTSTLSGAPRSLGRDEQGGMSSRTSPGQLAYTLAPLPATELRRHGAFIGELHDAADSFNPPSRPHWNVVIAPDPRVLDLPPRPCAVEPGPLWGPSSLGLSHRGTPWAHLYAEGHGEHWGPAAKYILAHLEWWADALLD